MIKPSTLLVLDGPANHLDIPSKEMLEEAITEYKGTVITVSHDRYFIRQIVNRVIEIKDSSLQDYAGDYNAEKEAQKKQKMQAFQAANQKSKGLKNAEMELSNPFHNVIGAPLLDEFTM